MPFKVTADYAAAVTLKVFLSVLTFALALTGYGCGADFGSRTTPVSPSSLTVAPSPTVSGTPLPSFPPIPPERLMNFPPLVGPSRTFIFEGELSYRVSDYTWQSRVVLYDNGACLLQYPPSVGGIYGEGRLPGAYREENGVIMFLFQSSTGRSIDEPWSDATGTLNGDVLEVRHNEIAQHSGFENAVYKRSR